VYTGSGGRHWTRTSDFHRVRTPRERAKKPVCPDVSDDSITLDHICKLSSAIAVFLGKTRYSRPCDVRESGIYRITKNAVIALPAVLDCWCKAVCTPKPGGHYRLLSRTTDKAKMLGQGRMNAPYFSPIRTRDASRPTGIRPRVSPHQRTAATYIASPESSRSIAWCQFRIGPPMPSKPTRAAKATGSTGRPAEQAGCRIADTLTGRLQAIGRDVHTGVDSAHELKRGLCELVTAHNCRFRDTPAKHCGKMSWR
jgi:hypothetical protein